MKTYLRSSSAGQLKTGSKEEFDDSLEGSAEPLKLSLKKEAIQLQKNLHAAKKSVKDHARSQGSLLCTLIRRQDRTLHSQLTAKQLEVNKYKANTVREDRENRKFRNPTLFDMSMDREKDLELIHELSRSVSREDIKFLQQAANDDMVEPYLRLVQGNNNLDDFLLSINAERVIDRIRPSSAKPSSSMHAGGRQRPYSAAAATSGTAVPNASAVRVRPSLSAPKARPISAGYTSGSINLHMVKYDLTNMHSPRGGGGGVGTASGGAAAEGRVYNTISSGGNGRRRPSMSDSIDSNMLHVEDSDYINAAMLPPDKNSPILAGTGAGIAAIAMGGAAVSAASAAHHSPPQHHTVIATKQPEPPAPPVPLNIHIDLPSIAVSKYIHSAASDYSPDSRTTLSISPMKTPLKNRRVKSAGAAGVPESVSSMQRPPLHHNYSYSASLGLQNYTTVSTTTPLTYNPSNHQNSSAQTSAVINVGSQLLVEDSGVVMSDSHRELSGTMATDSHREIFGYTPVSSVKQAPGTPTAAAAVVGSGGGVKRVTVGGGSPEGIAADIINDLEEGDPFMLDELLLLNNNKGNAHNNAAGSPNSPTLSHSKSRRVFPAVELQPRQRNMQRDVDDAVVCAYLRSEMSPTKPKKTESSSDRGGRPCSAVNSSGNRSPLAQRIQPRWK